MSSLLLNSDICTSIPTFAPQFRHRITTDDHWLLLMILLQFPLCTSILTFAPQFWHYTPSWKKRLLWRGKTQKRLPKFFLRLRDTYKKYILQKIWSKTAIPALSSGPSNLQQSIWGRHHQLDDQHRNPNMNDKDHLVGRLTRNDLASTTFYFERF